MRSEGCKRAHPFEGGGQEANLSCENKLLYSPFRDHWRSSRDIDYAFQPRVSNGETLHSKAARMVVVARGVGLSLNVDISNFAPPHVCLYPHWKNIWIGR
jgi:hypothetical protein